MRRLKASGFAETRPKVPNRTPQGAPIPENQAQNRRVLVRVYPMSIDDRNEMMEEVDIEDMTAQQEGEESGEGAEAAPADQ